MAMDRNTEKRAKTALSRWQRGFLAILMGLAVLLLANTLYLLSNRAADVAGSSLFAVNDRSLPKFYQVMLLSHTGLGLLLVGVAVVFVLVHLAPVWRRRKPRTVASGLLTVGGLIGLAVTGLFLLTAAASRENEWAWWVHVVLAVVVPAAYIVHRVASVRPVTVLAIRRFSYATVALAVVFVAGHVGFFRHSGEVVVDGAVAREDARRGSYAYQKFIDSQSRDYARHVSHADEQSHYFPSPATTSTGEFISDRAVLREYGDKPGRLPPEDFEHYGFNVHTLIGAETCVRCHQDIVEQWSKSAHRFASFNNPFYEATINHLREFADCVNEPMRRHLEFAGLDESEAAFVRSRWCSGCHDPALMFPGRMMAPIDRRTAAAQAGLTCLACHNIDAIHSQTGNAHYNLSEEQDDPYIFADARGGILAEIHDMALKARPAVHKRQMLKAFHKTSEFCSVCHKVNLDEPVNCYRWLRGQNEYDAWHDSGVAHNASRTFYLPAASRTCQDCHMPLVDAVLGDLAAKGGKVRSHEFPGPNTALPFVRGDDEFVARLEEFLRDNQLRIDVFALKASDDEGVPVTVYAPDHHDVLLPPGRLVQVEVVVRNLNVGHTFPGGTNDSNESWIEFSVVDDEGNLLGISGAVGEDRFVDPAAHFYRVIMVDRHGERIHRRDAQNIYAPVYARVIGPGTADVALYDFVVPHEMAGRGLTLRARLMWRKFERFYTEFAYSFNPEGFKRFSDVPDLPITEIAAAEVIVRVGPTAHTTLQASGVGLPSAQWMRMNDYGIGSLLQGNTRAALDAFREVARIAPDRVDGWRNVARAARAEGNLAVAYEALNRAEEVLPGDPQTAWVWGQVLQEEGQYEKAVAAYQRVLQKFPGDRATWRELAVIHFRVQSFADALAAAERVLDIDPEDRIAHYYRAHSLRALGRDAEADRAERAFAKYSIDESQQEVTMKYRLAHAEENFESQAIHVHRVEIGEGRGVACAHGGVSEEAAE